MRNERPLSSAEIKLLSKRNSFIKPISPGVRKVDGRQCTGETHTNNQVSKGICFSEARTPTLSGGLRRDQSHSQNPRSHTLPRIPSEALLKSPRPGKEVCPLPKWPEHPQPPQSAWSEVTPPIRPRGPDRGERFRHF